MNTLMKNLEDIIQQSIEHFSKDICDRYENVDPNELETIWNNVSTNINVKLTFKKTKKSTDNESKNTVGGGVEGKCPYIYTKGKNLNQICNAKLKDGGKFCGRHLKWENVEVKEKKTLPKSDKVSPKDRVIRKHKDIDMLWHSETKLVFDNKKTVIGIFRNKKVESLNDLLHGGK